MLRRHQNLMLQVVLGVNGEEIYRDIAVKLCIRAGRADQKFLKVASKFSQNFILALYTYLIYNEFMSRMNASCMSRTVAIESPP